jgi:hypothetical protein
VSACVLAGLLATAASAEASAQTKPKTTAQTAAPKRPAAPAEVQGTVLELDKDDLVLDLGSDSGATENLVAELWRPLRIKHPVTGKIISDRFKIGQVQIGQVRPAMSLAKASGTLSRPAQPGDLVIFTRAAPAPVTHAATSKPAAVEEEEALASEPAAPADADAKNVTEMFESLKNQNIQARVARYEEFLRAHQDSRFFTVIYEEQIALKRLLAPSPAYVQRAAPAPAPPLLVNGPGKIDAVSGRPVRVAVELGETATGAVLQLRAKGDTLFSPTPMARAGKGFFAVTIPASAVQERDLEYFIEAVGSGTGGAAVSVYGTSQAPKTIEVTVTPRVKMPPVSFGSVSVLTDYADYNGLKGNDYAWQTEGTFGVRFKDLGIRAVRMGFGVYRGVSGTVKELDEQGKLGRSVGLTYGHVEAEFGIHQYFSLIGRLTVGLLDDGVGGGGQLFARIGNDRRTNLLLGGEFLGGVGLRSIIELQLNTFERFPIVLRSEVTNQPAGASPSASQKGDNVAEGQSDVAGRGIVQLGYRITPDLTIAVRGSFQGRNINHAGPGFGGSVGYTW